MNDGKYVSGNKRSFDLVQMSHEIFLCEVINYLCINNILTREIIDTYN